jgi:hypothetical protein
MEYPQTADPSMIQTTFRRKEKKYLLDGPAYENLRRRLEPYMEEDCYGLTTVCSIYYDNDSHELIQKSLEKPMYKEKFRLRSYGIPKEDSLVFAEIKKKYDGIVYKRRVAADLAHMRRFINEGERLPQDLQIQKEIQWMLERYQLKPAIWLGYERIALVGKDDPNLRITFDANLRYRKDRLDLAAGDGGTLFRPEPFHLMEAKFMNSAPLWLTRILSEEKIYPGSFSKYGTCFQEKIFPQEVTHVK